MMRPHPCGPFGPEISGRPMRGQQLLAAGAWLSAVLGEHRHVPHRIFPGGGRRTSETAKQQIVVQVLHQYAFATHGIAYLQRSARSRFAGAIGVVPLLYSAAN